MNKDEGLHVDDYGDPIVVTVKDENDAIVDISTAVLKYLYFLDPDGVSRKKTPIFVTDGSDGKLLYITEVDFINIAGTWLVQAQVVLPSKGKKTSKYSFEVFPNIEEPST